MTTTVPQHPALVQALAAEYERAQAEEDKGFMAADARLEAVAHGKTLALIAAVRIVAGLATDADAINLLDVLDPEA